MKYIFDIVVVLLLSSCHVSRVYQIQIQRYVYKKSFLILYKAAPL